MSPGASLFFPGGWESLSSAWLPTPILDPCLWPRVDEREEVTTGEESVEGGEDPPETRGPSRDHRILGILFSLEAFYSPAEATDNPLGLYLVLVLSFPRVFRVLLTRKI